MQDFQCEAAMLMRFMKTLVCHLELSGSMFRGKLNTPKTLKHPTP